MSNSKFIEFVPSVVGEVFSAPSSLEYSDSRKKLLVQIEKFDQGIGLC